MPEFIGWEGDKLRLGTLEGGGAPLLSITDLNGTYRTFVFDSPQQVSDLITALIPFNKENN